MIVLCLLCLICVWMFAAYKNVKEKEEDTLDCFEKVDKELQKRYILIPEIISLSQKLSKIDNSSLEYINKLKNEVTEIGLNQDYMNRRIALDKELENKTELLLAGLKENLSEDSDYSINDIVNSYYKISDEVEIAKQEYNDSARVLRKAVDVFPTSFMARLNNIKWFDYIK